MPGGLGIADGGAWCPRRRRQRRMPLRRSEVMLQSCALFVASLASSQLAGRWPCRRILQPRGWTVPNYHPGWTVFHLPSTPWADDGRPIHILRLGYTRLGLQGSERGSSPPPRRGRDPAAQPRRTPASPQALHELQAGVISTWPEKSWWVLLVWQIGCILFFSWTS